MPASDPSGSDDCRSLSIVMHSSKRLIVSRKASEPYRTCCHTPTLSEHTDLLLQLWLTPQLSNPEVWHARWKAKAVGGIIRRDLNHRLPVNKWHLEHLNRVVTPDLVIMITAAGMSAKPVTGLKIHKITGSAPPKKSQRGSYMLPW